MFLIYLSTWISIRVRSIQKQTNQLLCYGSRTIALKCFDASGFFTFAKKTTVCVWCENFQEIVKKLIIILYLKQFEFWSELWKNCICVFIFILIERNEQYGYRSTFHIIKAIQPKLIPMFESILDIPIKLCIK